MKNNNQIEANKRWADKNKEHSNYLKTRSTARSFIRNKATLEDLDELEELILERRSAIAKSDQLD